MNSPKFNMDKALSLIIPDSGVRFDGAELKRLCKPCVYLFIKSDLALYVGMSKNGLSRPFGTGHRAAQKCMEDCGAMLVYYCHSIEAAAECESILIDLFQPKYNKRKKISSASAAIQNSLGLSRMRADNYAKDINAATALE